MARVITWMDTEEIRDGKSWLKIIFEDGIPTCDVVIVYFSENSITSKMVKRFNRDLNLFLLLYPDWEKIIFTRDEKCK